MVFNLYLETFLSGKNPHKNVSRCMVESHIRTVFRAYGTLMEVTQNPVAQGSTGGLGDPWRSLRLFQSVCMRETTGALVLPLGLPVFHQCTGMLRRHLTCDITRD